RRIAAVAPRADRRDLPRGDHRRDPELGHIASIPDRRLHRKARDLGSKRVQDLPGSLGYTAGMPHKTAVILRAADIDAAEVALVQRLNPRSRFKGAWLTRLAGLERIGLSRARIPPGGESFAYHAHQAEEEWIFIVSGRARARIADREYDLRPGDSAS